MENNIRPHKKNNGTCPYCDDSGVFTYIKDFRNMKIEQHISCNKYSLINPSMGVRYPLQNPLDENSSAYI